MKRGTSFLRILTGALDHLFALLIIGFACFILTCFAIWISGETEKDPYSEGMHWGYSIRCENGFVYKVLSSKKGTIQVLNSNGTPLRCGQKIH